MLEENLITKNFSWFSTSLDQMDTQLNSVSTLIDDLSSTSISSDDSSKALSKKTKQKIIFKIIGCFFVN